ncbi:MAG: Uma2 family endonuclease [Gammaproteobacteria bacterium]
MTRRVSFADLQRMPDDGNRYELYDGELRVVPSPLLRHQIVSQRLLLVLVEYANGCGGQVVQPPMDLVLTDYDVVQPDLMYFGPAGAAGLDPNDWVRVCPDLAIEVLSPSTARIDRGRKRELFERFRIPEYWVVDPDAPRIEVSVLDVDRYASPLSVISSRLQSPTLTGLTLEIEPLFAGLA